MSINITISQADMTVTVFVDGEQVKQEDISKDEYVGYMTELSGEGIDTIRNAFKLFKPSAITFKDVK